MNRKLSDRFRNDVGLREKRCRTHDVPVAFCPSGECAKIGYRDRDWPEAAVRLRVAFSTARKGAFRKAAAIVEKCAVHWDAIYEQWPDKNEGYQNMAMGARCIAEELLELR